MSVNVLDHYNKDGAKVMRPVLTREDYLALRGSNRQNKTLKAIRNGLNTIVQRKPAIFMLAFFISRSFLLSKAQ